MVSFQTVINLGASAPTAAQQVATDALVAGVLVGVQSSGLAGYNVSATNYTVVANNLTTTTDSSTSAFNSNFTSTSPSITTSSTLSTSSGMPYFLHQYPNYKTFALPQVVHTSRLRCRPAARERPARTRSRPTTCRTTTRCSLCLRWQRRAARVACGQPSASTHSRLWYCVVQSLTIKVFTLLLSFTSIDEIEFF